MIAKTNLHAHTKSMTNEHKMIAGSDWSLLEVKNPTTFEGVRLPQVPWSISHRACMPRAGGKTGGGGRSGQAMLLNPGGCEMYKWQA